jgi:hypothetical protein
MKLRIVKLPSMATLYQLDHLMQGKSLDNLSVEVMVGDAGLGGVELGAHSDDIEMENGLENPRGAQVLVCDDDPEVSRDVVDGVGMEMVNWVLVTDGDKGVCCGKVSGEL